MSAWGWEEDLVSPCGTRAWQRYPSGARAGTLAFLRLILRERLAGQGRRQHKELAETEYREQRTAEDKRKLPNSAGSSL